MKKTAVCDILKKKSKGERTLKRILETPLLPQGKATVAVSAEAAETIEALEKPALKYSE